jgi:hypothetical protein
MAQPEFNLVVEVCMSSLVFRYNVFLSHYQLPVVFRGTITEKCRGNILTSDSFNYLQFFEMQSLGNVEGIFLLQTVSIICNFSRYNHWEM